ncbi:MAG: hypothetical protein JNL54_04140 [Kineosporiaceae bacterium]|nr:hypothetical protein [Kineosporiaceae bacterium]
MNDVPRWHTSVAVIAAEVEAIVATRRLGKGKRGPWTPSLRQSDVTDIVAWGVVHRQWPVSAAGEAPKKRHVPTAEQAQRLRDLVSSFWDDIAGLCDLGERTSEAALPLVEQLTGRSWRANDLSEKLAGLLPHAYQDAGRRVPDGDAAGALLARLVEKVVQSPPPPLRAKEFGDAVGDRYDERWAHVGAENLVGHLPSAVGLGPDVRPPLLPFRAGPGGGAWGLGQTRSLYDRYRLHHIGSARSAVTMDDDERRPLPPDSVQRIDEEIARTCSPYGLVATEHHGVLRVLAVAGAGSRAEVAGQGVRGRTWHRWVSQLDVPVARPTGRVLDDELLEAVRDWAASWRAGEENHRLEEQHGNLDNHADQVVGAVVRKAWMELHRREREFVRPVRRRDVRQTVNVAYSCAVWPVVRGEIRFPDPPPPPVDRASHQERYRLTIELVTTKVPNRLRDWHMAAVAGGDRWVGEYLALVAGHPAGPAALFTADELSEALCELWCDPDE